MKSGIAVESLSALAHDGRLCVFRVLVKAGPGGLAAGEIARRLDVPPNTLSANLNILSHAGLIGSRRDGRSIIYNARYDRMAKLLSYPDGGLLQRRARNLRAAGPHRRRSHGLLSCGAFMTEERQYNILFLCTGNSARSIIAEAIMSKVGSDRFNAYSAGSHPKGAVNPYAITLLKKLDYDTSHLRSKSWDAFAAPGAPPLDFVITVCDSAAGEVCPAWPGQPMTAHWGMPDPAAMEGNEVEITLAFADTYRMLHNRLAAFSSLKISGLDRCRCRRK